MISAKPPHSEQKLFDKLKRQRLFSVLSGLAGSSSGYLDLQWQDGAIRHISAEDWVHDIINDAMENPDYTGTVRYHFGNESSVKLEYLAK